jgi:hypothetical protein
LRTALRTSRETMPPMPTAKHFSMTTMRFACAVASRMVRNRERAERGDAQHADLHAFAAQLVHRVLDGAQHRSQGDDDGFGVFQAIRFDQAARVASKNLV